MSFELHCPSCVRSFTGPSDSKTAEFLDRMTANGSWCPLGDGETIEDNVSTALAAEDDLGCPQCGEPPRPVAGREAALGFRLFRLEDAPPSLPEAAAVSVPIPDHSGSGPTAICASCGSWRRYDSGMSTITTAPITPVKPLRLVTDSSSSALLPNQSSVSGSRGAPAPQMLGQQFLTTTCTEMT